ncbi:DUF975 family protein [Pseudoramibacter sp. HA2172]|uniref:DUF975 family protein n=1 Tax=Pseudoramibacter faecis TaxID=3108534 RepID=UPI002E7A4DB0|nr:DUF975 family protein [Pseudoramibacter sp. HA2172]
MQWTRKALKQQAKRAIAAHYSVTAIAFVIYIAVSCVVGKCYGAITSTPSRAVMSLLGLALMIFVVNPLSVGAARLVLNNREGCAQVSDLFFGFKNHYGNAIKTLFLMYLFIGLWSLLFIVPGVIKSYQYYFVPFILAEDPAIDRSAAFERSKAMTDGYKGSIFVLTLSFIGWGLLCGVPLIIGMRSFGALSVLWTLAAYVYLALWLSPYVEQTNAELYIAMKAIEAEGYDGGDRGAAAQTTP